MDNELRERNKTIAEKQIRFTNKWQEKDNTNYRQLVNNADKNKKRQKNEESQVWKINTADQICKAQVSKARLQAVQILSKQI